MPFIKVDVSDVTKKVEKLAKNLADPSGVFSKTMSDMNRRASGKVADAVRNVFTIKKAEIVPSKQKTDLKKAGTIKVSGQTIADFKLYYEGRRLTPLHFGMTPKELPNNKKYRIYQKVKKNRTILAKPDKQGYVPFLAPASKGSSRIIPFQRQKDSREIEKVFKTVSLPQMVDNTQVREFINSELGDLLHKRFNHHYQRYLGEITK